MATYILFWNPDISSYTKERFIEDFNDGDNVGNWSFHEHEDVDYGDIFYMVKCGEGKTGIVMRGMILTECYESDDWSPKNRKHIFYANIEAGFTINPWSEAEILSPEELTEIIPDFNWFGGHSGRKLNDKDAEKLDKLWLDYLDGHPSLVHMGHAWVDEYTLEALIPDCLRDQLSDQHGNRCEICDYSYSEIFDAETIKEYDLCVRSRYIGGIGLKRAFYNICNNCWCVKDELLSEVLKRKHG